MNKRIMLFCTAFLCTTALSAQSKKDLQTEVSTLKAEVAGLKNEIEQLKKPKEVNLTNVNGKASYGLGVLMASNVKNQGCDSIDLDALTAGMREVFSNTPTKMNEQECIAIVQPYMQKAMGRKSTAAREEGKTFLEANKTKEGVKVTASGLQYKILVSGKGTKTAGPTDKVTVHYTGKTIDGKVFDSSVARGQPSTFSLNEVIPGWTEVIQLMHEGDKWMVYIPSQIGYGEAGRGPGIPPFAVLVFELELIKVN